MKEIDEEDFTVFEELARNLNDCFKLIHSIKETKKTINLIKEREKDDKNKRELRKLNFIPQYIIKR